jgi:hypothetical protein
MAEDTREDEQTMRNLRRFVGMFVVFSIAMALGVTIFAP